MTSSRSPRVVPIAVAAIALLGALAFLFVKTQAVDLKAGSLALSLLRESKDQDTRWDIEARQLADALELSAESAAPGPPPVDRAMRLTRILGELERGAGREAVAAALPAMKALLADKDRAFLALKAAHTRSLARLEEFERATAGVSTGLAAERLRLALRSTGIEEGAALGSRLAPLLAPLASEPRAVQAARAFVAAREDEAHAWQTFSFLTLGARLELTARQLASRLDSGLDEKERWRVYLAAYAAALLLATASLAARVIAAQAALRRANDELERRVTDRTRDLSEALARLKESEAQLVHTEKMSSLGQLVAGVAHEINTPLAYVKNGVASVRDRLPELRAMAAESHRLLGVLRSETPDPAELHAAYDALAAALARLDGHHVLDDLDCLTRDGLHGIEQISELVANLRNFSRLDRSKVASFDLNDCVRSTFLIARPLLRTIEVEKRLGEIPRITCSPSQINQVLLNLVTNAAQAIDEPPGRIAVTTRREGADHVAIEVQDNGRGIDAAIRPRIFDPFFTTKEVGKGTGLGLSIAHKIVADHGGRIEVRSRPGEGATFVVILPTCPPQPADQPALAEAEA